MLKEISAAASGERSESASQEVSSDATLHPLISERVSNTGIKREGVEDTPSPPPAPTPEQQKQMLEFLMGLQKMKDSSPGEFDKAMSSLLGIPEGSGALSEAQKANSLTEMIANIQSMREDGHGDIDSNISIGSRKPGAKGNLHHALTRLRNQDSQHGLGTRGKCHKSA